MQDKIIIATHSGSHHADDAYGVAVLLAIYPHAQVIRTRDPEVIAEADFAVDVGGVWDPCRGRFDHHQKGFDGRRPHNNVLYASAGLVWSAHGTQLIQQMAPDLTRQEVDTIWGAIDDELVQHLDMADTGAAQGAPGFFGLSAITHLFNVTRVEMVGNRQFAEGDKALESRIDAEYQQRAFLKAVELMQSVLFRMISHFYDEAKGNASVRAGERLFDGKVLVLPVAGLTWENVVCHEMPDVRFVIYPDSTDRQHQVRTVPVEPQSFKARLDLPEAWAGLRDEQLAQATGVADAVFCHNARFIGGAVSREGAIEMARQALAAAEAADPSVSSWWAPGRTEFF